MKLHSLIALPLLIIIIVNHVNAKKQIDDCVEVQEKDQLHSWDPVDIEKEHVRTNIPLQSADNETLPNNRTELKRRNATLRHLSLFSHTFSDSHHHWLLNLGEECNSTIHEKWVHKTYQQFYTSDEWHEKICTFTRFLHCSPATNTCECAPMNVYGIKFVPAHPNVTGYSPTTPCLAGDGQPCFFYLAKDAWPGLNFRASVKLQCPQVHKDGEDIATYPCRFQRRSGSTQIAKLCKKCIRHVHKSAASRPKTMRASLILVLSLVHNIFIY